MAASPLTTARAAARRAVETALVRSGVARVAGRRLRGRALVLAYHNVVPSGEPRSGELSLHLPQAEFARHLEILGEAADVVPLASVLDEAGDPGRRRVAITFDDAYEGAMTAGLDELRRRGLPATVFVTPGLLGCDTWWDRLGDRHGGVIPEVARRHALETLQGDRDRVLDWSEEGTGRRVLPRIATESILSEAARQSGVTFGAHSWSHRNLSVLDERDLAAELAPPLQWLRERFANTIPWLAYPYGLTSAGVAAAAARVGFRGAFRVRGGWMASAPADLHSLPRLGVPAGLSANGLALRLSGIAASR